LGADGVEVARGLINYSSGEARLIARKSSNELEATLGFSCEPEMVHRDNMVILEDH
jgi:glutamate 5-kinase